MSRALIDLGREQTPTSGNLPGLTVYLKQLIGEPFRFARVSYGDELTLHFGDLRPARSLKLKDHLYGTYTLGMRGSPWVLKPGPYAKSFVVSEECLEGSSLPEFGRTLSNEELESARFLEPESRVTGAWPFVDNHKGGFGLQLWMSDGSNLTVLPSGPEVEEPGDEELPRLADWELSSPHGLLRAGPDLQWSFEPRLRQPST